MRNAAVVVAGLPLLAVAACTGLGSCSGGDDSAHDVICTAPAPPAAESAASCPQGESGFACRWAVLYHRQADAESLAAVVGEEASEDEALRRLFPFLEGKTLVDGELPPPGELIYRHRDFEPSTIAVPIDWTADPLKNVTWRAYFQNLSWIGRLDVDSAAYVVTDWAERALHREPALDWTWGDAMAHRMDSAMYFVKRYAESRTELNRRVLRRVAETVLLGLYTTAQPQCYQHGHNHGVMQDLKLMRALGNMPNLVDREAMFELARKRLVAQFPAQVTSDGMVVENSPGYHAFMLELMTQALEVFATQKLEPPPEIVALWTASAETLVHLMQPNLTLVQFGSTMNSGQRKRVNAVIQKARALGIGDPGPWNRLEWITTRGKAGSMPDQLDRVWTKAHYAAFRERWDTTDAPITAHLKCSRLSKIHYDRDELSIEIYGRGGELIVDSGVYSNEKGYALTRYQAEPWAHNTLVVDGKSYESKKSARIVAHELSDTLSWVQATHENYEKIGIERQYRTFAYARPNAFAVVDEIEAPEPHDYVQHFHLHPRLTHVEPIGTGGMLAATEDPAGPAVLLVALEPVDEVATRTGGDDGGPGSSWYFPKMSEAVPSRNIMFRYRRAGGSFRLPVLLFVLDSRDAPRPAGFSWEQTADAVTVSWSEGGAQRTITTPAPPD